MPQEVDLLLKPSATRIPHLSGLLAGDGFVGKQPSRRARPFCISQFTPWTSEELRAIRRCVRSAQRSVSGTKCPARLSRPRFSSEVNVRGIESPRATGSLHLLDVAGLPILIKRGFFRTVEPEDGEISSARGGGEPVAFFAFGGFGAEIEVRAAVGVLRGLVLQTERWEWLAVSQTRSILRFVER